MSETLEKPELEKESKEQDPPNKNKEKKNDDDEQKKGAIREYFESAVVTIIMAIFGMTFIVQAVKVPTGSMLNTILIGDHLLVNKFIFGQDGFKLDYFTPHRAIRRGDVIVFKYPGDPATNYVKRVIGLPGETIEIKGPHVFINGQQLPEHYLVAEQPADPYAPLVIKNPKPAPEGINYTIYYSQDSAESEFDPVEKRLLGQKYAVGAPFTIPPNHYFAMGDNRDNSQDSRYWGTVPRENILGKAFMVYYSIDVSNSSPQTANTTDPKGTETEDQPAKPGIVNGLIYKSRWSRMGTIIK